MNNYNTDHVLINFICKPCFLGSPFLPQKLETFGIHKNHSCRTPKFNGLVFRFTDEKAAFPGFSIRCTKKPGVFKFEAFLDSTSAPKTGFDLLIAESTSVYFGFQLSSVPFGAPKTKNYVFWCSFTTPNR